MNTVKTPLRHLYKYAFIVPALFISYFFVYPFHGRASAVKQIPVMDTVISPKRVMNGSGETGNERADHPRIGAGFDYSHPIV